jgi:hypothetical protein
MSTLLMRHLTIMTLALVVSSPVHAAKPASIKYIEDVVLNNNLIFSHYQVHCSDGKIADISAWNKQTKWCVGKGKLDNCSQKQLTTAKKVCR